MTKQHRDGGRYRTEAKQPGLWHWASEGSITNMAAVSTARWAHLTPGGLTLLFLVLQGFLWISRRFQWHWLNHHGGWTVLIAVVSVGVFVLLMLVWLIVALLSGLPFQYNGAWLLVLAGAMAFLCAWLPAEVRRAMAQRQSVAAINELGGLVVNDYMIDPSGDRTPKLDAPAPAPAWLRSLLGEDLFSYVVWVDLSHTEATDGAMKDLKGLVQLEALWLRGQDVTDAGLEHLRGLRQLRDLALNGTKVTDAGLEHLKGLSQLRRVWLGGTKVTDEGVKKLRQALPNCEISR